MAFEESLYIIGSIMDKIKEETVSGIPPKNLIPSLEYYIYPKNAGFEVMATPPSNTVVENQIICTVAGLKAVYKADTPPTGPDDGILLFDIPSGQKKIHTLSGLVNGKTYYVGLFSYSDHGVYNLNKDNILKVVPTDAKIWGFHQDFSNLDPDTSITYISGTENQAFTPMMTNTENGTATAGSWISFLQDTLKNYPCAVLKDGTVSYQLDPLDYTKKKDGTNSDAASTSYTAGGFYAWINKIYMKEVYAEDGMSRDVYFSDKKADDDFYPTGFYTDRAHPENEIPGLWIPMAFPTGSASSLKMVLTGSPYGTGRTMSNSYNDFVSNILPTSSNLDVTFFGGPILNVIRDLCYMLFKTTDIQKAAGYGRSGSTTSGSSGSNVIRNGDVPGFYGTKSSAKDQNWMFNSMVLGAYALYIEDPTCAMYLGDGTDTYFYTMDVLPMITSGGTFTSVFQNVFDDPTKYSTYQFVRSKPSSRTYSSRLVYVNEFYGSIAMPGDEDSIASDSTGLCDANYTQDIARSRLNGVGKYGYYGEAGGAGPACYRTNAYSYDNNMSGGCAIPMLVPKPNYTPPKFS